MEIKKDRILFHSTFVTLLIILFCITGIKGKEREIFYPFFKYHKRGQLDKSKYRGYHNKVANFNSGGWTTNDWFWILDYVFDEMEYLIPMILSPSINPNPAYTFYYPELDEFDSFIWNKCNNWNKIIVETDTISYNSKGQIVEIVSDYDSDVIIKTLSYTNNGHLKENKYIYKSDDIIREGEKQLYTYNVNNKVSRMVEEEYETSSGTWEKDFKVTIAYNNSYKPAEIWEYLWSNDSGKWEDVSQKFIYPHDKNNNCTEQHSLCWNDSSNSWIEGHSKTLYTYNDKNKMTEEVGWKKREKTGQWYKEYKIQCIYDKNGNLTEFSEYMFDTTINEWIPSGEMDKYSFIYNDEGYLIEETVVEWDSDKKKWINYLKLNCMYDTGDNIFEEIDYCWDEQKSGWKKVLKLKFEYNDKIDPKCISSYYLDTILQEWILDLTLPVQIIYSTKINNPLLIHNELTNNIEIRNNRANLLFCFNGITAKKENLNIFDLQGKLITTLKPEIGKKKTHYRWNYNIVGNKVYVYSLHNKHTHINGKFFIK